MAKALKVFMERRGTAEFPSLQFAGEHQKSAYQAFVKSLPDKQIVEMVLSRRKHAKTNPQLGYWFGVLMPFAAAELLEAGHNTLFDVVVGNLKTGVATTPTTVELLFKTLFAAHKQLDKPPLKRDMTDEEMGELIDFTITWLAQQLEVYAPPPEPMEI